MGCGVVLGEVVGHIFVAWAPVDKELALVDSVLDPVETHVHGFGFASVNSAISDTCSCGVIGLDGCCWLQMFHLDESGAESGAVSGIVEQTSKFGFGG